MQNLQSPLHRVTPILTWWASSLLEDEMNQVSNHDNKENTADIDDNHSDGLVNDLSDVLSNYLSEPESTMPSGITSMCKMLEEPQEMLNNAIQQNALLCTQNAELIEVNCESHRESIWTEAMKTKIFNMTGLEQYCGGAKELDNFLDMLWSNYESYVYSCPHGYLEQGKPGARPQRAWRNDLDLA